MIHIQLNYGFNVFIKYNTVDLSYWKINVSQTILLVFFVGLEHIKGISIPFSGER